MRNLTIPFPSNTWNQSLRGGFADFLLNWPRKVLWAGVISIGWTVMNVGTDFAAITWRMPLQGFAVGLALLAFMATVQFPIECKADGIKVGGGKNCDFYPLEKISSVLFDTTGQHPSMILNLHSGRQRILYLNINKVPIDELKRYFTAHDVAFTE